MSVTSAEISVQERIPLPQNLDQWEGNPFPDNR